MTAPTPTDRYREIRSDNLTLKRRVDELEMRLRLAEAREEKALHRARLAELNSKRWHALLLRNKIEALPVSDDAFLLWFVAGSIAAVLATHYLIGVIL